MIGIRFKLILMTPRGFLKNVKIHRSSMSVITSCFFTRASISLERLVSAQCLKGGGEEEEEETSPSARCRRLDLAASRRPPDSRLMEFCSATGARGFGTLPLTADTCRDALDAENRTALNFALVQGTAQFVATARVPITLVRDRVKEIESPWFKICFFQILFLS